MSLEDDDAMRELVPPEQMTAGDWAHVRRVTSQLSTHIEDKYQRGKAEHLGSCWLKPGMLAHALDEAADLPVYLLTLREQMQTLIRKCREGSCSAVQAADEIERWLAK